MFYVSCPNQPPEEVRKIFVKGNIGCGIFVDLQKASDAVEHDILIAKLEHYGICVIANDWFKSYFFDRKQIFVINGYVPNQASIKHDVAHS